MLTSVLAVLLVFAILAVGFLLWVVCEFADGCRMK